MFSVTLAGETELKARLEAMPTSVRAVLESKVQVLAIQLQAHVIRDKLHGQVLNQRSGALARSIQQQAPITEGDGVYGRVFSSGDVKYAAIHEYGGTTPPHDIVPSKAEALMFVIGGKTVFANVVHHPGSKMPERSFLRSSLKDMAEKITEDLKTAVVEGLNKQ